VTTFVFTREQQELRRTVRRFLADKSPPEQVRRLMDTEDGYDLDIWSQLSRQLGLVGLTVPEERGGSGCGPVEQLIVCEEMGRVLLCAPYLSTAVLANSALLASADRAAQADLMPEIVAGSLVATLAVPEDDGTWSTSALRTQARIQGSRWLVTGQKKFVLDGASAGLILVAAQTPAGPSLFAVDGAGRPIGSFQAIKHKCADMLLEVESARSAAYYAAWAAADGASDLPLVASLAKACCSEAYSHAAAENIQIHGGIGFTWEHDAHLYYRRAKSAEAMLGTPAEHRDLAAGYLIDAGESDGHAT
jgi:alkylation response protein AidB-like acyl-CoA dehydrogenase